MLKLRQMQQRKQQEKQQQSGSALVLETSLTPAQLRLRQDLASIDIPPTVLLDESDLLANSTAYMTILPDEGFYRSGTFKFSLHFKDTYPIEPPKVKCLNKIYHPNIDVSGNVCLNILREDWSPVLDLQSILVGLLLLFLEPNAKDPLNKDAAFDLQADANKFGAHVQATMRGGVLRNVRYDRVVS
ncbi:LAMI_0H14136g1_1 [Lachancea mirantina]|uniref:NEDD8-conjugating enzyme UBC12 n=1 Tax=Lachancea mirantina TaxID=1230905 RepID=A0A1G4KIH5_9SACH|nr:LAMI_0H14136g1_1 [Lachancea mirantina]